MSDERRVGAPYHQLAPSPHPTPNDRVWTVLKAGQRIDCELRFLKDPAEWELRFLFGGDLAYGRLFVLYEHALEGAEAQRQSLIDGGWCVLEEDGA